MSFKLKFLTFFLFVFLIFLTVYGTEVLIKKDILLSDERDSYSQIIRFTGSFSSFEPEITSVRGYHALIALILKLFHTKKTFFLRYAVLLVNLLCLPVIFLLGNIINRRKAVVKTLEFCFMPIVFPFLMLMYGDILSVCLVSFAVYFVLRKKYNLAGIFSILAMGIKQNNIIWLIFCNALSYVSENGLAVNINTVRKHFKNSLFFLLGIGLFILFIFINKGMTLGQHDMHPLTISNLGNVYLMLFLFFFLFLPENISNSSRIVKFAGKNRIIIAVLAFWFFIYMATFHNSHYFNQSPFYLRNRILVFFTSAPILKAVFFLIACYSVLSIAVTKLVNKNFFLLYPFTILFLIPLTLIEQRYFLIPLTLFLMFKKNASPLIDYFTVFLYLICSVILFDGIIVKGGYFL